MRPEIQKTTNADGTTVLSALKGEIVCSIRKNGQYSLEAKTFDSGIICEMMEFVEGVRTKKEVKNG